MQPIVPVHEYDHTIVRPLTLESRIISVVGVVAIVGLVGILAYDSGYAEGRAQSFHDAWAKPQGMDSCVLYPDGGKKCKASAAKYVLPTFVECYRTCKAQARSGQIK